MHHSVGTSFETGSLFLSFQVVFDLGGEGRDSPSNPEVMNTPHH